MPTKIITGTVYYSQTAYGNQILKNDYVVDFGFGDISGTATIYAQKPIINLPIVLMDALGNGICSITDANGVFKFNDVEYINNSSVKYVIMECFGRTDGVIGASWKNKKILNSVEPKDPCVYFIAEQGLEVYEATDIVSLSPNQFNINIDGTGNVTLESNYLLPSGPSWDTELPSIPANTIYFMDCCIRNIPLAFQNFIPSGPNLITKADNGTFGKLPAGTCNSTSPTDNELSYPDLGDFTYSKYSATNPNDAYYSITNIATSRTFDRRWFEIPDHTFGDERGRFMIVNGINKPRCFFSEQIDDLDVNGKFIVSAWIVNIYRCSEGKLPYFELRVKTTDENPIILYEYSFETDFKITTIPTWRQIGAVIDFTEIDGIKNHLNDGGTLSVKIEFISTYEGSVSASGNINGNDIGIDDIRFRKYDEKASGVKLTKSVNEDIRTINEPFEYTITLTNDTNYTLSDCIFIDPLPDGTELDSYSIKVSVGNLNLENIGITANELEEGKNISNIISENVEKSNPYYDELVQGKIPGGVSLSLKYSIKVTDVDKLRLNKCVKNIARYDYFFELDEQNGVDIERTIYSDEETVYIKYPVLSIDKEIYKVLNGNEVKINKDSYLLCGDKVVYKIILINTGDYEARNVFVTDKLDLLLYPDKSESWIGSISSQVVSPEVEEEKKLTSDDIEILTDRNDLKINNISVPPSDENSNGECVIKIYCKVKCE